MIGGLESGGAKKETLPVTGIDVEEYDTESEKEVLTRIEDLTSRLEVFADRDLNKDEFKEMERLALELTKARNNLEIIRLRSENEEMTN